MFDKFTSNTDLAWSFKPHEIWLAATRLRHFFLNRGITVHPGSDVNSLMESSKRVGSAMPPVSIEAFPPQDIWNALTMLRVSMALHASVPSQVLQSLTKGRLRANERQRSVGKDLFWELEVGFHFRHVGLAPEFREPDLVFQGPYGEIGIACKKLYSDKHLQRVVSGAVDQISKSHRVGIVALNIDDLIPENHFVIMSAGDKPGAVTDSIAAEFFSKNRPRFERYCNQGRLAGIVISFTCLEFGPAIQKRRAIGLSTTWRAHIADGREASFLSKTMRAIAQPAAS